MSYSIIELCLHLESFKNIDLSSQGIYQFQISIYNEVERDQIRRDAESITINEGLCYNLFIAFHLYDDVKSTLSQSLSEDNSKYLSTSFRVQYADQEIQLNEGCLFRLEINSNNHEIENIYMEIDLYYAEFTSKDFAFRKPVPLSSDLRKVSTSKYKLYDLSKCIHFMQPVTFNMNHFCLLRLCLHSSLLNFKFKPKQEYKDFKLSASRSSFSFYPDANVPKQSSFMSFFTDLFAPPPPPPKSRRYSVELTHFLNDMTPLSIAIFTDYLESTKYVFDLDALYNYANKTHQYYVKSLLYSFYNLNMTCTSIYERLLGTADKERSREHFKNCINLIDLGSMVIPDSTSDPFTIENPIEPNKVFQFSFPVIVPLEQRTNIKNINNLADIIEHDVSLIATQVFSQWNCLFHLITFCDGIYTELLFSQWEKRSIEHFKIHFCEQKLCFQDRWKVAVEGAVNIPVEMAEKVRSSFHLTHHLKPLPIEDVRFGLFTLPLIYQSILLEQSFNESVRHINPRNSMLEVTKLSDILDSNNHHDYFAEKSDSTTLTLTIDDDEVFTPTMEDDNSIVAKNFLQSPNSKEQSRKSSAASHSPQVSIAKSFLSIDEEPISDVKSIPSPLKAFLSQNKFVNSMIDSNVDHDTLSMAELEICMKLKYPGKHLFVLVHGFQGNSWDMHLFRDILAVMMPTSGNAQYLCSSANENDTEGDIISMGENLANEICSYIKKNRLEKLGRISFIGHSLGCVLIRSALTFPCLSPYLNKLYTLISLASPHCGYIFNENLLLSSGLYVMKNWYKSACLSQLSLTDHEDPKKTKIYWLSKQKGFEYFKNIFLFASPEDKYVPYHSARIELPSSVERDPLGGPLYTSIVSNLLQPIPASTNFSRIDVSFVNNKSIFDKMIGRAAHICFLDSPQYIWLLAYSKRKYLF